MATTKNTTYKIYNGTDWDTIYFKTTAGNVGETNGTLNFLRPNTHTVNGKSFWSGSAHQGITLYGTDILVGTTNSELDKKTLRAAITSLNSDVSTLNEFMAGFQGDTEQIASNLIAELTDRLTAETEADALVVTYATNARVANTANSVLAGDGGEDAGSVSKPVYLEGGKIYACGFEVLTNVPANAKFTDTTYNNASTSAAGLMSATDKSRLDSMYNVWAADGTGDTLVNKVQEVLTIFQNYPESDNLVTVLAGKADVSKLTADKEADALVVSFAEVAKVAKSVQASDGSEDIGDETRPVYVSGGNIIECSYTLEKSVPADAKFTDTVYTHPTTSGNKHIPSGGSSGQFLKYSAAGTATWATLAKSDVGLGNVLNVASYSKTEIDTKLTNVRKIFQGSTTPTGMVTGDIWLNY